MSNKPSTTPETGLIYRAEREMEQRRLAAMGNRAPTPRTDAVEACLHIDAASRYNSMSRHSRQLERELTAAQSRAAELEQQLHALRLVCGTTDANKFETRCDRLIAENAELRAKCERLEYALADFVHPDGLSSVNLRRNMRYATLLLAQAASEKGAT